MCGIAGILRLHDPRVRAFGAKEAIPEAWLDVLDESIRYRGPDGCGRYRDRVVRPDGIVIDVALVHRRLAIIDAGCGGQPMVLPGHASTGAAGEKATVLQPCPRCAELGRREMAVVFNGCVYNHRELRVQLEAAGHVFSTDHSDTEVLLHASSEWREMILHRLRAMHAFALWDGVEGLLTVGRDGAGEKPLYQMMAHPVCYAFSSSAGGLAKLGNIIGEASKCVSKAHLSEWVRMGHAEGPTPITGVYTVLPGDGWVWGKPGWSFGLADDPTRWPIRKRGGASGSEDQQPNGYGAGVQARGSFLESRIESLIESAVVSRLESDVPVACLLSGGIDSSIVALMARRHLARVTTVCVRMPAPGYDESRHARAAAEAIGTEHVTVDARAQASDDLIGLIRALGLPLGDSSLLPTYWSFLAAREHAKAVLTGDGGDELFVGYTRYEAVRWAASVGENAATRITARGLSRVMPSRSPGAVALRVRRLLEAGASPEPYRSILSLFNERDSAMLMPGLEREKPGWKIRSAFWARYHDMISYLPGDLLRKVDTASMLAGVEARAPLLDVPLVNAAFELTEEELLPGGQRKGLLRAIARQYLPRKIVDRPKMGFAIPIGEWFRNDFGGMRQLLMDQLRATEPFGPDELGINAMIDMRYVRQLLDEHDAAGERSLWPWRGRDHSQRLYMLLVLSIWAGSLTKESAAS